MRGLIPVIALTWLLFWDVTHNGSEFVQLAASTLHGIGLL